MSNFIDHVYNTQPARRTRLIPWLFLCDGYKLDHRRQYPWNTRFVYSNGTPRNGRDPQDTGVIAWSYGWALEHYFIDVAHDSFFSRPREEVLAEYSEFLDSYLGPNDIGIEHVAALYDLGYLPLEVRAVPEGTFVPYGVPIFTVENTRPEFFWLTNYIETLIMSAIWLGCTSATTAMKYKVNFTKWARITNPEAEAGVMFQGHDFSFRGMQLPEAAAISGTGHLLSFVGTDTLPSVWLLNEFYDAKANPGPTGMVGVSVPATEHSVMTASGPEGELEQFRRLLKLYKHAPVFSVVSDSFDYWQVLTEFAAILHDEILALDGKIVFRPDSGDPVKIICGDPDAPEGSPEWYGTMRLLWNTFGGTLSSTGYKVLNEHVGVIYGDSITLDRAEQICAGLEALGFATTNMVYGIGSFTYTYVTRDTHGFAMKATWVDVDGEERQIFKRPKTDKNSLKVSARGRLRVEDSLDGPVLVQNLSLEEWDEGTYLDMMDVVFHDGHMITKSNLADVRARVQEEIDRRLA